MQTRFFILFFAMFLLLSCADESSSGPANENSSASRGSEIVCDIGNEGMIVKPADGEMERICKDGSWVVIESSSSGNLMASSDAKEKLSSSSSFIGSETKQSSSSSINALSSSEESSSSSFGQSSDSHEGSQSSSSDYTEESSSSSDDSKMYLCDDGVTYVLDLANCKVVSSSSESGSPESSSDNEGSSSSGIESSNSIGMSSSSVEMSSSSEESSSSVNGVYDAQNNTLTDLRDGQVYKTVTIGTQIWMAENLNYLPNDTVGTIWAGNTLCGGGAWKETIEGDCEIYGRLYEENFTTMREYSLAVCPDGWSLPTRAQYQELVSFLGDDVVNKMRIDNSIYWDIDEATNQSGFSAVPSGHYAQYTGFNPIYEQGSRIVALYFVRDTKSMSNTLRFIDKNFSFLMFGDRQFAAIRCIKK